MNKKKNICLFSTSRSDYYLLSLISKEFKKSKNINFHFIATGNHFDKKKGNTYKDIINDRINIDFKIPYNLKNSNPENIINSIQNSFLGIKKVLKKTNAQLIFILGDRYELLPISITALLMDIPIAHVHGGEVTEGAFDDSIRHAVTKLSNIHFACNKVYKKRIIQMGESPKNVYDVGGIGAEIIKHNKLIIKKKIYSLLNIKNKKDIILVALHPETNNKKQKFQGLFKSLLRYSELFNIIFTSPNSDPGHELIHEQILNFKKKNKCFYIKNLGSKLFHSVIANSKFIIGNSSSGILEAPILKTPTIDIGDRQKGRLRSESVFNCGFDAKIITKNINKILYKKKISYKNVYYSNKNASKKIVNIINKIEINKIKIKKFYDIN
ncbi:UDP-N-acetylglucosamine 2-epimerase [Candidatus Pelagibacter sp.]|nr:UDP-N-acetylglucosamine 2-epimerase [Candidatus Pelagibacter sp.]|tara:strand:- start:680 stop:1825 length:1146 start_codon:yes stop_codon:yes gene_type:complete